MTANLTLSTGQTSGITGLSIQTIQRYVRRYREHFSETARKPAKGRRFTESDLKNLLVINYLLNTKQEAEIEKTLRGEVAHPLFEIRGFMTMFLQLEQMQKECGLLLDHLDVEKDMLRTWQSNTWLSDFKRKFDSHADAIEALREDVRYLKLVRELKHAREQPPADDPRRKTAIERWH
jgi:DNA-binding transcriptional MerR regulator